MTQQTTLPTIDTPQMAAMRRMLPWLVAIAFFMEALDTTILNTAVPAISASIGVAPLAMKAVLSSYTLALAVFIPVSGWVADRFGTRRVFATAIGVFTVGSLLCGLSQNLLLLVACRILQGVGGAMMVPVGRLTLVRAFAKSELLRAMSFVAIPSLVGPMLGPVVGGAIVRYLHWRVIFFVNIPIGLFGLYLVARHLPDYRRGRGPALDVTGFVLFGAGIALLSYVLEVFGEHTLSTQEALGLLGIALVLLFGYVRHGRRKRYALLRLELFRIRTLRIAVAGNFVTRLGAGGMPFLLPLLYQVGLGYSPLESGLLIMPQSIAAMSLKFLMPKVLAAVGYRRVLLINTVLVGACIALYATIDATTPIARIVLQSFVFGFVQSLQFTSMNTLVYADVGEDDASAASTVASTVQQLSLSFGVAAASLAAALFVPDRDHTGASEMVQGTHRALVALGVLTMVSASVYLGLTNEDGAGVSQHHEPGH